MDWYWSFQVSFIFFHSDIEQQSCERVKKFAAIAKMGLIGTIGIYFMCKTSYQETFALRNDYMYSNIKTLKRS